MTSVSAQTSDFSTPSDQDPFDQAVRSRSWDWLAALQRRLNVDLQLVDERCVPVLAASTSQAADLGRLMTSGSPALRAALAAALRTRTPHAVTLDDVQVVCVGLPAAAHSRGALLLARRLAPGGHSPQQVRSELELIALWLTGSIAAHLASAPAAAEGGDRLAVLGRLLGDAAANGGDRDVVGRFADVLAVWHDLELYGYVDSGQDTVIRAVSLPGADLSRVPRTIAHAALPDLNELRRLGPGESEALGLAAATETLAARVAGADDTHSWLVLMRGPAAQDARRLGAYVTMLAQALAHAAAAAAYRVVGGMAQHLVDAEGDAEKALRAAIGTLREALPAAAVGVVATAATGVPLARVASPAADEAAGGEQGQVLIVRRVPDECTVALTIALAEGRAITPHERYVAGAAADLLVAWTRRLARRGGRIGERRAGGRSFSDVLDRIAVQTLERGSAVSVIVLSDAHAVLTPGLTQRWVAAIRGALRAADLVGMLGEGEVALLLPDTAAEQARDVAARLARLAREGGGFGPAMQLGIASRRPGEEWTGAFVQARESISDRDSGGV